MCDGDIDPEWIESLNSVLDDNRLLTMPSGERIQFGPNVNFLFETHDLSCASPATISRMGMIFLRLVGSKDPGCKKFQVYACFHITGFSSLRKTGNGCSRRQTKHVVWNNLHNVPYKYSVKEIKIADARFTIALAYFKFMDFQILFPV